MLRFIQVLTVLGLLWESIGGTPAYAQSTSEPGVLSPTSGWLVGPAAIAVPAGVKDMPLPCVMLNQFDNGFVMRLSGGGQRLAALVIDFRQTVFTTGQRYPLRIFVLPDYKGDYTATAYDTSTLIVNLGNDPQIYRALAPANGMDLSIGPTVVRFDLTGLSDGLRRLESCFGKNEPDLTKLDRLSAPPPPSFSQTEATSDFPSAMAPSTLPPALKNDMPPSDRGSSGLRSLALSKEDPLRILGEKTPLPIDRSAVFSESKLTGFANSESNSSTVPSPESPDKKPDTQVWRATAGENVQDVLARWSRKEGVSLVWTARRQGQVGSDFRYEGSFEDAVSAFLAQSSMFHGEMKSDAPPRRNVTSENFR